MGNEPEYQSDLATVYSFKFIHFYSVLVLGSIDLLENLVFKYDFILILPFFPVALFATAIDGKLCNSMVLLIETISSTCLCVCYTKWK